MVTTTAWTGQMRSAVTPPAVRHISGRVLTVTSVSTTAGDVTARRTAMTAATKRTVPQLPPPWAHLPPPSVNFAAQTCAVAMVTARGVTESWTVGTHPMKFSVPVNPLPLLLPRNFLMAAVRTSFIVIEVTPCTPSVSRRPGSVTTPQTVRTGRTRIAVFVKM